MARLFSVVLVVCALEFSGHTESAEHHQLFLKRTLMSDKEASPQRNDPACQLRRMEESYSYQSNPMLSEETQSSSLTNERLETKGSIAETHFGISHSLPVWKITSEVNSVCFDTNVTRTEAFDIRPLVDEHTQHPKLPMCLKSERNSSMNMCPIPLRCVQTSTGIVCLKARPRKGHPRRGRPLPSSDSPTTSACRSVTGVNYLTHIQRHRLEDIFLSESTFAFLAQMTRGVRRSTYFKFVPCSPLGQAFSRFDESFSMETYWLFVEEFHLVFEYANVHDLRVMIKWPAVSSGLYLKFVPNSPLPEARSTYFQSGSWNQYQFVLDFRSVIDPKTYFPYVMIRLSYQYQGVNYHLAVTGNEKCCEEVSYSVRFILASSDVSKKIFDVKDTIFWFYVEWPGHALRSVAFPRHYLGIKKDRTLVVRKPPLDVNFRLDIIINNEDRNQDERDSLKVNSKLL